MKNIVLIFLLLGTTCFAQKIEVADDSRGFGFVHEGDTVRIEYSITNTGQLPLIFSGYEVECGCTSVDLPKEPLAPGKTIVLTVLFNTAGKMDRQDRTVKLNTNAVNSPAILRFKGVVLKRKQKK
jgi:hypothetical protein